MKIPDMKELGLNEIDPKDRALYMMWESSQARMERTNKMQFIVILVLILALIGTNAGWIYWESQWQYVDTTTVTQDLDASDGGNAIINDGVHINGESETDSNNN
jgi:hypothetical protein